MIIRYYISGASIPILAGGSWLVAGYGRGGTSGMIIPGWILLFLGLLVFGPGLVAWHYEKIKRERLKDA